MRPFIGEVNRSRLVFVRRKSGHVDIFSLMGGGGTSDPPKGVKEGADEVGTIYILVQHIKIYNCAKNWTFLTESDFPWRVCGVLFRHSNTEQPEDSIMTTLQG